MTVVSLKAENSGVGFATHVNGVFKIELSDGSSLLLTTDYLNDNSLSDGKLSEGGNSALLETGRQLSSGEEYALRFAAACYRAERIALKLVARAEQGSLGLTVKLERRGFEAEVAKAVVLRLMERNLLDDGRFAELWLRSRLALKKAPSPQWLLVALGKRGIGRTSSLKALDKVLDPQTEYALLLKYLEKVRFPKGKRAFSLRAQLKHEGFSSETINRYFDNNEPR